MVKRLSVRWQSLRNRLRRISAILLGWLSRGTKALSGRLSRLWSILKRLLARTWRWLAFAVGLAGVALAIYRLALWGYKFEDTGFAEYTPLNPETGRAKTLWDWMELFLVPSMLAFAALWFNWQQRRADRERETERTETERHIAEDSRRENRLQAYLGQMKELLLDYSLRDESIGNNDEVRRIARARTLTVLRGLDGERKGLLLRFLHESQLISEPDPVVNLEGVRLEGANLGWANLADADLAGANLRGGNLESANLGWANLEGANLRGGNLEAANLGWAKYSTTTTWPRGFTPPPEAIFMNDE